MLSCARVSPLPLPVRTGLLELAAICGLGCASIHLEYQLQISESLYIRVREFRAHKISKAKRQHQQVQPRQEPKGERERHNHHFALAFSELLAAFLVFAQLLLHVSLEKEERLVLELDIRVPQKVQHQTAKSPALLLLHLSL